MTVSIVLGCVSLALLVIIIVTSIHTTRQQTTIDKQFETIQKLLNREPVTYKEVNVKPPKQDTDRPIAWGGRIADRDEI